MHCREDSKNKVHCCRLKNPDRHLKTWDTDAWPWTNISETVYIILIDIGYYFKSRYQ